MRIFAQNEPLTETELDRLEEFLETCEGGKAMNIEEVDGFSPPWSRAPRS